MDSVEFLAMIVSKIDFINLHHHFLRLFFISAAVLLSRANLVSAAAAACLPKRILKNVMIG